MVIDIKAIQADLDSYLAYECAVHGGTGTGLQMCYSHEKGHRNFLEWLADGGLTALLAYIEQLTATAKQVFVLNRCNYSDCRRCPGGCDLHELGILLAEHEDELPPLPGVSDNV